MDSAVMQLHATTPTGDVATIWPMSNEENAETRIINREFLYDEAAAYGPSVVPELSHRWSDRDFKLSNRVRDSGFNSFQALKALISAYKSFAGEEFLPLGNLIEPFAPLAPALSGETKIVNFISSSLEIQQNHGHRHHR
jgi:hypothetical protein